MDRWNTGIVQAGIEKMLEHQRLVNQRVEYMPGTRVALSNGEQDQLAPIRENNMIRMDPIPIHGIDISS